MKERSIIVNLKWANIFSLIVMAAISLLSVILWEIIWGNVAESAINLFKQNMWIPFIMSAVLFAGFVVHELIHALTFVRYTKDGWKSISFGIIWKMFAPYCHCSEPMKLGHFVVACLMPLLVLGIVPWITGFCFCCGTMTAFGVFMIAGASGDILVAWKLRKEDSSVLVIDHPTEAGCIILEK